MKPDSPEWIAAKAQGDRAELAIADWFRGRGFDPYKALGFAPFDLLLQCRVEVKHDLKAPATGNVAIEIRHHGQPSGILTSQAQFWAVVVGSEAIIAETEKLRSFVLAGKFREAAAGDAKASTVLLVPIDKLKAMKGARHIMLPEVAA